MEYTQKDLETYFVGYNKCEGATPRLYKTNTKTKFQLKITGGISISTLHVLYDTFDKYDYRFPTKATPTFGTELEFLFPINHYKWSMFLAPSYSYFTSSTFTEINYNSILMEESTVKYKAVNVDVGIRYHFLLSNKSKLHLSPSIDFYFPIQSSFKTLKIENGIGYSLGAGYTYGRIGGEVRYSLMQLLHNYPSYNSNLQTISVFFNSLFGNISCPLVGTTFAPWSCLRPTHRFGSVGRDGKRGRKRPDRFLKPVRSGQQQVNLHLSVSS